VYEVAEIITQETRVVHGERMKLYADSSLNVTEAIKLQKSFDDESFIIEKILEVKDDHRLIKKQRIAGNLFKSYWMMRRSCWKLSNRIKYLQANALRLHLTCQQNVADVARSWT